MSKIHRKLQRLRGHPEVTPSWSVAGAARLYNFRLPTEGLRQGQGAASCPAPGFSLPGLRSISVVERRCQYLTLAFLVVPSRPEKDRCLLSSGLLFPKHAETLRTTASSELRWCVQRSCEAWSFYLGLAQAIVAQAKALGWRESDGGEPHSGMRVS